LWGKDRAGHGTYKMSTYLSRGTYDIGRFFGTAARDRRDRTVPIQADRLKFKDELEVKACANIENAHLCALVYCEVCAFSKPINFRKSMLWRTSMRQVSGFCLIVNDANVSPKSEAKVLKQGLIPDNLLKMRSNFW
jgi:hypothetical protein